MTKKTNYQSNQTFNYTPRCGTHVELSSLAIMINVTKISCPNMTHCDCSVTFDDVITLKSLKCVLLF